jgi:hypothetical protein
MVTVHDRKLSKNVYGSRVSDSTASFEASRDDLLKERLVKQLNIYAFFQSSGGFDDRPAQLRCEISRFTQAQN